MDTLAGILIFIGLASFLGGVIWLIVRLFRKRPKRLPLLCILVGVVSFIAGGIILPEQESDSPQSPSSNRVVASPTATPNPTSTPVADGKNRTEPVPYGFPVTLSGIEVTVLDVTRGWDSDEFSLSEPDEGHEWVVVRLRLRNVGDPDKTERYNPLHFRLTGQSGVIYGVDLFAPDTDNTLGSGEFFGGAEVIGDVVIQTDDEEGGLVLIYSPPFAGSRYLSLEKP